MYQSMRHENEPLNHASNHRLIIQLADTNEKTIP